MQFKRDEKFRHSQNKLRSECLSSSAGGGGGGGYQRGRSILNCHVVLSGTFCLITQVRKISHP